jgi:hypothetical protein
VGFAVGPFLTNGAMSIEILYKEESYKIVGACFEVYREKGCGFLQQVYQECLEIELRLQEILYVPKKSLALEYESGDGVDGRTPGTGTELS